MPQFEQILEDAWCLVIRSTSANVTRDTLEEAELYGMIKLIPEKGKCVIELRMSDSDALIGTMDFPDADSKAVSPTTGMTLGEDMKISGAVPIPETLNLKNSGLQLVSEMPNVPKA